MDWVVGLLLLVVGGVMGFFIARFTSKDNPSAQAAQQNEKTVKEIMAQQAEQHLAMSRHAIDTLKQQCDALNAQFDAYEQLLTRRDTDDDKKQLSYFGDHADAIIGNQQKAPKQKRAAAEFQPRDFSNESSGLFDGSKNQQVVDEK